MDWVWGIQQIGGLYVVSVGLKCRAGVVLWLVEFAAVRGRGSCVLPVAALTTTTAFLGTLPVHAYSCLYHRL